MHEGRETKLMPILLERRHASSKQAMGLIHSWCCFQTSYSQQILQLQSLEAWGQHPIVSKCLPLASCFPLVFQIFVSHLSSTCLVFALQVVNGGKCLPVCSRRVFPNVFHCLPICVLLVPHNVIQRPVLSQMWSPNRFPTAFQLFPNCISCNPDHLAQPWSSITGIYLNSQLYPLALILNAFEIVTAAVGLQSWVNELSIQDAEHQVAEVISW